MPTVAGHSPVPLVEDPGGAFGLGTGRNARETEIDQLQAAISAKHDVVGLNIPAQEGRALHSTVPPGLGNTDHP